MSCDHKFLHLQFFNFLHAFEAFGNVVHIELHAFEAFGNVAHIELTLPRSSTSHVLSVMEMDSSFSCVLFDQI